VIGDSISSLEGIASFVNLQQLTCEQNLLTSLDVSQNTHLEWLNCAHNQLTSLVFPTSVHGLLCNNNQLAALDLSGRAFDFLDVSYNQLTELDLSQTDAYFTGFGMILGISGNLYTSFTMPDHYVDGFYCENTQLVTMDLSAARFVFQQEYKYIGNNPNLQYVNIKNGGTDFCTLDSDEMPCDGYSLVIENNPALAVLCADESELVHYAGAAQTVTSDCSGLGVASLEIGSAALWPNPAMDVVTMEMPETLKISGVSVINTIGQIVQDFEPAFENGKMTIDVSSLHPGTYLLRIKTEKGTTTRKLIKL